MENSAAIPTYGRSDALKELKAKRTYEKPAIVYRAPLEALANVCGELGSTGKNTVIDCANLPKKS